MKVYRLSRKKYAEELNGKGAAKFRNRWNSKGVEIIYTAESRALAMAEVLVHLSLETLPEDFCMIEIEIPNVVTTENLPIENLQENWNNFPHTPQTQIMGDNFVASRRKCVLKVPSAVVRGDFNLLINPHHKDFKKIKITEISKFPFDPRMFT